MKELSMNPSAIRKRALRERIRMAKLAERESESAVPVEPVAAPEPLAEPAPAHPAEPPAPLPKSITVSDDVLEPLGDAPLPRGIYIPATETAPSSPSSPTRSLTTSARRRDSAWHRERRAQLLGGGSREKMCEEVAGQVIAIASKMDQIIKAAGKEPVVPAEKLRPALELTLDELVPAKVDAWLDKPAVYLVTGLLMAIGQTVGAIAALKRGAAASAAQVTAPTTSSAPSAPNPMAAPPPSAPATVPSTPPATPRGPQPAPPLPTPPRPPSAAEMAGYRAENGELVI